MPLLARAARSPRVVAAFRRNVPAARLDQRTVLAARRAQQGGAAEHRSCRIASGDGPHDADGGAEAARAPGPLSREHRSEGSPQPVVETDGEGARTAHA